jgi:predicted enzyme related to lactoylglutathione lyase
MGQGRDDMQIVKSYPDGVVCWVDLTTPDVTSAKSFYHGLFGWTFKDIETEDGLLYSMAQISGYNVCGIGPMDPGVQEAGELPYWTTFVKQSDVDAISEKAAAAGGEVLVPPFDVLDSGRMTMIEDPTGAMVGVWQPREHIGAQLVNIFNTLVWNELQTRDVAGAKAFYAAVFGWTYDKMHGDYIVCKAGDRIQAGIFQLTKEMADVPANWANYFLVEDAAATVKRAEELGGETAVPSTSLGESGRFAVLRDPQGAYFSLHEYDGPAEPPPGYEE